MNAEKLRREQIELLQRYFDGECEADERRRVRDLLEASPSAKIYLASLKSMRKAVQMAEEEAWSRASLADPEELARRAGAADWVDAPLEELAPLLERHYDGETDAAEAACVEELAAGRDDVADYLAQLEQIGDGIRQASDVGDVDFDGFWEGIEAGIDELESGTGDGDAAKVVESFDPKRHRRLVYRYHDGEVTDRERRRVEAWIDSGNAAVGAILETLDDIGGGVRCATEAMTEGLDDGEIYDGIGEQLDAIDAQRAADNVVAISREQDASEAAEAQPPAAANTNWQKVVAVGVAAMALVAIGAIAGPQIFDQPGPVETETVVIFDSIESAPGSSVMLHSPELADHSSEEAIDLESDIGAGGIEPSIRSEDDEAEPTILWVVDDDDDDDDDDEDRPEDDADELPRPI